VSRCVMHSRRSSVDNRVRRARRQPSATPELSVIKITIQYQFHCRLVSPYTVKNTRISKDSMWRVFHILLEPVPYTFASINRRNSESQCGPRPVLHYYVDLRIQTYSEPVPLKYVKLATKYPLIYGYFTVYGLNYRTGLLHRGLQPHSLQTLTVSVC